MKSVLILDCGNYNSVTTVQVNYIKCLIKEGFHINYIIFKNGNEIDLVKYNRWPKGENINYIEIDTSSIITRFFSLILGRGFVNLALIFKHIKSSKHLICMEYYSAVPAYIFSRIKSDFSYQVASLELNNNRSLLLSKAMKCAKLISTQDDLRKEKIIEFYSIPNKVNVHVLYNTSLSWEEITKDQVKLPIEIEGQKIILFIGSLISEHCIEDVIDWVGVIDDEYCIVFHGWGISELNRDRLNLLMKRFPKKVWLSDICLNEDEKWKMYNIADIGVVMFNKAHINNEYAGLSAGKLFDFIRLGIPVAVSDTNLLNQFVNEKKIGGVINSLDKLNENLNLIHKKKGYFLFREFNFESGFNAVLELI